MEGKIKDIVLSQKGLLILKFEQGKNLAMVPSFFREKCD
jgi:hypothetical protein